MTESGLLKVRLEDTELHYAEAGVGETVVLVHGVLADLRVWERLAGILSQRFRVISYSRRGAYPNEAPRHDLNGIPLHAKDLSSLISQLSRTPVHLVAESYGGYVATYCALRNPTMIRSLVIDEPPILPIIAEDEGDLAELRYFENEVLSVATDYYKRGRHEDAARTLIGFLDGSPDVYDSLPQEVKETLPVNLKAMFAELKAGFDVLTAGELGEMKVATLLLKSEFGPRFLKRVVDRLSTLLPNCELAVIEGTTHGNIVDSAAYDTKVLEFLSRH